ncbi:hypothetical protein GE061_013420 [Apolygus lucorum]|uniref:Uncharacterized protein n=1 Tax=Apolygus lucorum TaxID=248454 RepID=A0A6A4KC69_APOLU|nr:hypothetical protein GE061_013420 [Apolygus lucorum]
MQYLQLRFTSDETHVMDFTKKKLTKKNIVKRPNSIPNLRGISCECLVFSSTFGKEYGRFSSPDFPKPYPPGINCLLYTFIAGSQEIIELTFFDFNVHQSVKK